jgi:hypothetical protein
MIITNSSFLVNSFFAKLLKNSEDGRAAAQVCRRNRSRAANDWLQEPLFSSKETAYGHKPFSVI